MSGGIFNDISQSGRKTTILPTVLQVSKAEIDYWANMTCFYDKNWEYNPKLSTVPITFLHILNVAESISAQGSEKRVIVYEAPPSLTAKGFEPVKNSHPAYRNNLEVIMDNVIVQPKQYQMDVVVAHSLIGPYVHQGLNRLEALLDYMSMTYGNGSDFATTISGALRATQTFVDTVQTASDLMDTVLGATEAGSTQIATMNKNSLEAMAGAGHVVLFKKWTGYDYAYGIITKVDISKKANEEGVSRGTITFQEAPILNISQKDPQLTSAAGVWATIGAYAEAGARIMNLGLAAPFIKLTGVMDEAGAPGSDSADGGDFSDLFKS